MVSAVTHRRDRWTSWSGCADHRVEHCRGAARRLLLLAAGSRSCPVDERDRRGSPGSCVRGTGTATRDRSRWRTASCWPPAMLNQEAIATADAALIGAARAEGHPVVVLPDSQGAARRDRALRTARGHAGRFATLRYDLRNRRGPIPAERAADHGPDARPVLATSRSSSRRTSRSRSRCSCPACCCPSRCATAWSARATTRRSPAGSSAACSGSRPTGRSSSGSAWR